MMRGLLVASLGVLVAACSGASSSDLFEPTQGQESDVTEPSKPGASTPGTSGSTSPGTDGEPGRVDPAAPDPTDPADPGKPNAPACTVEIEPNDRQAQATPFTACLAGVLEAGDVDHGTVTAPAKAKTMRIEHAEKAEPVQYQVFAQGSPFALATFTDEAPEIDVEPGTKYLVRVRHPGFVNGAGEPDAPYELHVVFE